MESHVSVPTSHFTFALYHENTVSNQLGNMKVKEKSEHWKKVALTSAVCEVQLLVSLQYNFKMVLDI